MTSLAILALVAGIWAWAGYELGRLHARDVRPDDR